MKEKILSKLLSGKYFMTVVTTLVFVYAVKNGLLDKQVLDDIIKLVFMFYFLKESGNAKTSV